MEFKEIEALLNKYKFYGFTVTRDKTKTKFIYTYHSVPYFAVNVIVDTIKLNKEKIVTKVQIGDVTIDDEKNLIPTLDGVYKIHKRILYGGNK